MLLTTPFLLATEPSIWQGLLNFVHGRRVKTFAGMVDLLFSKRAGDAEVDQHAVKMVFESLWAAFEAHVPTPAVPAFVLGVPSLVIAGAEDRLISNLASGRTALYHRAEYRTEDELGHFCRPGPAHGALPISSSIGLSEKDCNAAGASAAAIGFLYSPHSQNVLDGQSRQREFTRKGARVG
jgi:hypothetical protein